MSAEAPLLGLPEAPIPPRGGAEWVTGRDGLRLRVALFHPEGAPRGSVVLSPGRTEPIEKYFETIGELQARGFVVLVHDWRGQGRSGRFLSDPLAGHARGWRRFISDFRIVLDAFEARLPRPWLGLAHSMGAGLTLLAIAEGEGRFSGLVTCGAMLGLRLQGHPAWTARTVAWFMGLVGRSGTYVYDKGRRVGAEGGSGETLTHDAARWARFKAQIAADPALGLGSFTWGWLAFALAVCLRLDRLKGLERINMPWLLLAAERDALVSNDAQRDAAHRAPQARLATIKDAFHELLLEIDPIRDEVWREFDAFADVVAPGG